MNKPDPRKLEVASRPPSFRISHTPYSPRGCELPIHPGAEIQASNRVYSVTQNGELRNPLRNRERAERKIASRERLKSRLEAELARREGKRARRSRPSP